MHAQSRAIGYADEAGSDRSVTKPSFKRCELADKPCGLVEILEHRVYRCSTDRTRFATRFQRVSTSHAADSVRCLTVRDDSFTGALHADHTDTTPIPTHLRVFNGRLFAAVPFPALACHRFCSRSSRRPCQASQAVSSAQHLQVEAVKNDVWSCPQANWQMPELN